MLLQLKLWLTVQLAMRSYEGKYDYCVTGHYV
jgi:hypothetical protein